ncbi:hypothetical protein, partial [Sporosarcina sp. NPDC096371]|uniref:hypothetical protein n=1 Tax=Sporosarcina sp. NPDC096371 TaxID=3364530 RepID=UPI0038187206
MFTKKSFKLVIIFSILLLIFPRMDAVAGGLDIDTKDLDIEIENPTPDLVAPIVTDVQVTNEKLTPSTPVKVIADLSDGDDGSGVKSANITYKKPSGATKTFNFIINPSTNKYEATITAEQKDEEGEWIVNNIFVVDKKDNERRVYHSTTVNSDDTFDYSQINLDVSEVLKQTDFEVPILTDMTLQSDTVEAGEKIQLSVVATDNESGVNTATAYYKKPSGKMATINLNRQSNTDTDTFFGSHIVKPYDEPGHWTLTSIELVDKAGNRKAYTSYTSVDGINRTLEHGNVMISGTTLDVEKPVIQNIFVQSNNVANRESIKLTVEATDNFSGIASIRATYKKPSGSTLPIYLYQQAGTDTFSGTSTIGQYDDLGTYELISVIVEDFAGNSMTYNRDSQISNGTVTLKQSDVIISGTTPDHEAPTLKYMKREVSQISANYAEVKYTVEPMDMISGVSSISGRYARPSGKMFDLLFYKVGNAYEAKIIIDKYDEHGIWKLSSISLRDNRGNSKTAYYMNSTGDFENYYFRVKEKVTVSPGVPNAIESIEKLDLQSGDTYQLKPNLRYTDGTKRDITADAITQYTSSNPAAVTISKTGLIKVNDKAKSSKVNIAVTYGEITQSIWITINGGSNDIQLEAKPLKTNLSSGQQQQINVIEVNAGGRKDITSSSSGISYTSSNPTLVTVSKDGLVTVNSENITGVAVIKVSYEGLETEVTIQVTKPTVQSLAISPNEENLSLSDNSLQLIVKAFMSNGSTKDVTKSSSGTTYTSSNKLIAQVDSEGLVSIPSDAKSGKVTITATNSGKSVEMLLNVTGLPEATSIHFKESKIDMKPGETTGYELIAILSDGSEKEVTSSGTYTRSNTYLTIDSATQQVKMSSSAKDGQVITLTGKYEGLTATAEITVKDGSVKPTSIYFKETKLDMKPGETAGYELIAILSDGSEEVVTSSGTFTRSNTYLTIDRAAQQMKMSSSAKKGQVITLTGKYEGLTATAEITVTDSVAKPTSIY